jgi:hypothetical protein
MTYIGKKGKVILGKNNSIDQAQGIRSKNMLTRLEKHLVLHGTNMVF